MKRLIVFAFLALAGCSSGTPTAVSEVIAQINKICGFQTDDVKALEALLAAANPGSVGVIAVANAVCDAAKQFAPKTMQSGTQLPVTVTVQGVPITGHF